MKKSKFAVEHFKNLNCAQSVLLSFAPELKLDDMTAVRIAAGFGGGMGRAKTCGAVTGSYMVLGMMAQTKSKSIQEIKDETKAAVKKFNELFLSRHGSLSCKKLLGVDISTPEGAVTAKDNDLYSSVCAELVASACDILEENF